MLQGHHAEIVKIKHVSNLQHQGLSFEKLITFVFVYMHICAPHDYTVPMEARKEH